MNNQTIAHRFFYDTKRECNYARMSVSFNNNKFYSYSTVIGLDVIGKNNQYYLLVSYNTMSSTTSKHIGHLISACPYGRDNIIRVPFRYGENLSWFDDDYIIDLLIKRIIENIEHYSKSKLTQKQNRLECFYYYETLLKIDKYIKDVEFLQTDKFKEFETLYNNLNNSDKVKELKQKQRQMDAEKIKQAKKELKEFKEKYSYMDLVRFCFDRRFDTSKLNMNWDEISTLKSKIKNSLNVKKDLSFIWFDDEFCRTSQSVTVNRADVEVLLKLWEHNKLKHGMMISYYTVLSVTDKFVTVGCHKIPTENLRALLNEMQLENVA